MMGDNQEDVRKAKKYSGYVVYVAYRLEPKSLLSHSQKLNKVKKSDSIEVEDYQTPPSAADTIPEEEEEDEEKRVMEMEERILLEFQLLLFKGQRNCDGQ